MVAIPRLFGGFYGLCSSGQFSDNSALDDVTDGPPATEWTPKEELRIVATAHYGTKPGCFETSNHTLFHELGCERESKQMSA